jgi:hypothetical protein
VNGLGRIQPLWLTTLFNTFCSLLRPGPLKKCFKSGKMQGSPFLLKGYSSDGNSDKCENSDGNSNKSKEGDINPRGVVEIQIDVRTVMETEINAGRVIKMSEIQINPEMSETESENQPEKEWK